MSPFYADAITLCRMLLHYDDADTRCLALRLPPLLMAEAQLALLSAMLFSHDDAAYFFADYASAHCHYAAELNTPALRHARHITPLRHAEMPFITLHITPLPTPLRPHTMLTLYYAAAIRFMPRRPAPC